MSLVKELEERLARQQDSAISTLLSWADGLDRIRTSRRRLDDLMRSLGGKPGRWVNVKNVRLKVGQWYVLQRTQYVSERIRNRPKGVATMAQWTDDGWSDEVDDLGYGNSFLILQPRAK